MGSRHFLYFLNSDFESFVSIQNRDSALNGNKSLELVYIARKPSLKVVKKLKPESKRGGFLLLFSKFGKFFFSENENIVTKMFFFFSFFFFSFWRNFSL
jgi:hypothetical protein